jgi:DNA topoisomerase-1
MTAERVRSGFVASALARLNLIDPGSCTAVPDLKHTCARARVLAPCMATLIDLDDDLRAEARDAGLRYVTDAEPGITRRRVGRGFTYRTAGGQRVADERVLERIRALAIPPAWQDVWICRLANGHLQATGRDARRRKQYRYHAEWQRTRGESKFSRIVEFGDALPTVRERIDADLSDPGIGRDKVLAAVLRLLDVSLMRVGNSEYARLNDSFGATTIRNRHADVNGHTITFRFTGKSSKLHEVRVVDRRLARIVGRCQELPGQELFAYLDDDGEVRDVGSADVNEYLRETAGDAFSAKDFRTFGGTVMAAETLALTARPETLTQARHVVNDAVKRVAAELGNTPAVARASYIHPAVPEGYLEGTLPTEELAEAMDEGDPRLGEEIVVGYLRDAETG